MGCTSKSLFCLSPVPSCRCGRMAGCHQSFLRLAARTTEGHAGHGIRRAGLSVGRLSIGRLVGRSNRIQRFGVHVGCDMNQFVATDVFRFDSAVPVGTSVDSQTTPNMDPESLDLDSTLGRCL